jgi:hypothetical protein
MGIEIESARDQGSCGCCWSFSLCTALGDRYSVKYKIKPLKPSTIWLITSTYTLFSTTPTDSCSYGGNPYSASQWLEKPENNVKLEKCWPYSIIEGHANPPNSLNPNNDQYAPADNCCYNCCGSTVSSLSSITLNVQPGSTSPIYVFSNGKIDPENTINFIQSDILNNGPVVACFQLYEDFNYYWNNVAQIPYNIYIYGNYTSNVVKNILHDGGHSVAITGWGTGIALVNNTPTTVRYWEVRNSWGNSGDNGYGKIAFSTDAPANSIIELDIPSKVNSTTYSGGAFTFQPGILPSGAISIVNNQTTSQPTKNNTSSIDIFYYIFIGLVVLVVILLGLYYYNLI